MVKVSIEVREDVSRFRVAVQAESIRRAVIIVGQQYPGTYIKVEFPIDPEGFFVKDPAARAGLIQFESQKRIAV